MVRFEVVITSSACRKAFAGTPTYGEALAVAERLEKSGLATRIDAVAFLDCSGCGRGVSPLEAAYPGGEPVCPRCWLYGLEDES